MRKGLFQMPQMRMEAIDFQINDKFGPEMETIIEEIMKKVKKGYIGLEVQKLPEIKELEKVIFKRLKMTVSFVTTGALAAIIPFFFSQQSVFLPKFIRGETLLAEQDAIREKLKPHGFVDENNVQLGGVFSEYVHSVYMNFSELHEYGLTIKEIVSILLHELGHGFYSCAYSARMDRANQILSDALRKGKDAGKEKFIEVTYKELKGKVHDIKKESVEQLTSKNPAIVGTGAFKIIAEVTLQQQEDTTYDQTSFEALADHFSARFGYGEYLVTGLERLYPGGVRSVWYFDALQAASTTMVLVQSVMASILNIQFWAGVEANNLFQQFLKGVGFYKAIMNIIWVSLMCFYFVKTSGESGRDYTYDDLEKRYNRIRNQVIESIKKRDYTKKDAEALIATAEMIGNLIKGVKAYRGPLDFLFNTFNPKDRRAGASIARQQAIEDLLSNDLFLATAKLDVNT